MRRQRPIPRPASSMTPREMLARYPEQFPELCPQPTRPPEPEHRVRRFFVHLGLGFLGAYGVYRGLLGAFEGLSAMLIFWPAALFCHLIFWLDPRWRAMALGAMIVFLYFLTRALLAFWPIWMQL